MGASAHGYEDAMSLPGDAARPGRRPADCAALAELLVQQHEALRNDLARLVELHGCAREDVFLQVRRRLAVHAALEQLTVAPRTQGGPELEHVRWEVAAAEDVDHESPEFDGVLSRLIDAHERHARTQEEDAFGCLTGDLTESEQAAGEVAVRLWEGEGDVYLGGSYDDMLAVAGEQLTEPEEHRPGPPG